ncbi:MAG: haloacid dehalogenase-like hydrolase [Candidatus Riflebacteria bacterium]|nr:haloacid dehalogenase-like hydrolase [Candidatus Riflebacteria bacterium]
MRLLLFDIDGTLMLSGGAGARALTAALHEVFGMSDGLAGVRLNGHTDRQIVADALALAGLPSPASPAQQALLDERYVHNLRREMPVSPRAVLLPGVTELLQRLVEVGGVALALLTGNIEPGARIKLERFGLNRYFPFGAFGTDSAVRRDLVPIAIARGEEKIGVRFDRSDVVVIGDTERDVDCGRHCGVKTVAVATGGVSVADLQAAGADLVLPDLADTARTVQALLTV